MENNFKDLDEDFKNEMEFAYKDIAPFNRRAYLSIYAILKKHYGRQDKTRQVALELLGLVI